jgi:hypothetical protein
MRLRRLRRVLGVLVALPMVALAGGLTTASADQNAGTGTLSGTIVFGYGQGVPLPTAGCNPTSWTFGQGTGGAIAAKLPGQEYSGPIGASGSGGSSCAFATNESGVLSISAAGSPLVPGQFACNVGGNYLRVASHVLVIVNGTCSVANNPASGVVFVANAEFIPATPQTTPQGIQVGTAAFTAHFVIYPSSL